MERIYRFTDEHGEHEHVNYDGPYDFKRPVTCKTCLLREQQQRDMLCEKYGWKEWPFPKEV